MAVKFEWNENYELGIPEIDLQHKKLISISNELYDVATKDDVNLKLTILRAIHIQLQKSRKCRHVKGRKQTTFTTLLHQMTMFVLWQRLKIQTQIFIHQ